MRKNRLILVAAGLILVLISTLAGCTSNSSTTSTPAPSTTPTSFPVDSQPVEVVSVSGPLQPINPGGPIVEINLKNVSALTIISLSADIELGRAFNFNFDVSASRPLLPDASISSRLTLIGGGFSDTASYPLTISGQIQSGGTFSYSRQIQITPPPASVTSPPPSKTDWEQGSAPPAGIGGLNRPGALTEAEKTEVIEIALKDQRVSEWLQQRTDYRTSAVDWYAIMWNSDGEAGTWWSMEYDTVTNGEVPDYVNPSAYWYPGVTIAVGEGTIYQMQIAVDLETQKVAMEDGPYPSLSSPDRFKNIPAS
jgi:hypothetical protein